MELADLYASVPAAQEEDLLEEVERARHAEEHEEAALAWASWPAAWPRCADLFAADAVLEHRETRPEPEQDDALSPGQVLGLLAHRLGARVVRVEGPGVQGR